MNTPVIADEDLERIEDLNVCIAFELGVTSYKLTSCAFLQLKLKEVPRGGPSLEVCVCTCRGLTVTNNSPFVVLSAYDENEGMHSRATNAHRDTHFGCFGRRCKASVQMGGQCGSRRTKSTFRSRFRVRRFFLSFAHCFCFPSSSFFLTLNSREKPSKKIPLSLPSRFAVSTVSLVANSGGFYILSPGPGC